MDANTETKIKENIRKAKEQLKTLKKDIDKAKNAGIDVVDKEKQFKTLSTQLTQYESAYLK